MNDHQAIDAALATIAALDTAHLGRRIHAALELDRRHPSRPDGYPTQYPGHATTPTGPAPIPDPDDLPVGWNPVERAVVQRAHHHDEIHALTRRARDLVLQAVAALDLADGLLNEITTRRRQPPDHNGCALLAEVGGWAPIHRTIPNPTNPTDRIPVGRWAYEFVRRTGRTPTPDERLHHMAGHRATRSSP